MTAHVFIPVGVVAGAPAPTTVEYSNDGSALPVKDLTLMNYVNNLPSMFNDMLTYIAAVLASIATSLATVATNMATTVSAAATATAAATAAANQAAGITATSTSAVAIGTGSITLRIQASKQFAPPQYVLAADHSAPTTNNMSGQVTVYNSTTGDLTFLVPAGGTNGSGTPAQYDVGLTGPIGNTGAQGATGGGVSEDYTFDTGTTNADPGAGKLRFNSATQNLATALYVNTADINAVDMAAVWDTLDASSSAVKGQLRFVKKTDATKFITANLLSRTTHTGYREFSIIVTASSGASPFAGGAEVLILFSRTGDSGSSGDNVLTADGGGIIANLNTEYDMDSSAGTLTQISLPPTPTSEGQWVAFRDVGDMLNVFPVTILRNGHNVYDPSSDSGAAADVDLDIAGSRTKFVWRQALNYWKPEVE